MDSAKPFTANLGPSNLLASLRNEDTLGSPSPTLQYPLDPEMSSIQDKAHYFSPKIHSQPLELMRILAHDWLEMHLDAGHRVAGALARASTQVPMSGFHHCHEGDLQGEKVWLGPGLCSPLSFQIPPENTTAQLPGLSCGWLFMRVSQHHLSQRPLAARLMGGRSGN